MKPFSTFQKSIMFVLCLLAVINLKTFAQTHPVQEKVLINEVITWKWSPLRDLPYAGNGFYWWHRPLEKPGNVVNFGEMSPTDWTDGEGSYDYSNGEFFLRFEVLEQPTKNNFSLQFGIWQDRWNDQKEIATKKYAVGGGSGAYLETSIGKVTTWKQIYPNPLDYTRPENFFRVGITLWAGGTCIPLAQGWTNPYSCADPETIAANFFPMKASLTVVAVPKGYTFSSWENYPMEGVLKYPTPNYSVDFINEETNKIVPSTDLYATNASMTGAVSGIGKKITLTPGQNKYFKKKANGDTLASNIQMLTVPGRPATPNFSYDIQNKRTLTPISSEYEYSTSADMSSAITGNNTTVSFEPGDTLFIRKKATATSFKSNVQNLKGLTVDDLPNYQVDFINEQTTGLISSNEKYNYNNSENWITGTNEYLKLTPGKNVYITRIDDPGNVQQLIVPARPIIPTVSINYESETIDLAPEAAYSTNPSMSGATVSDGSPVKINPGTTVYIQKPATDSSFKSLAQTIIAPARPSMPDLAVDYISETTNSVVPTDCIVSENANMSDYYYGTGAKLPLTPGNDLFIRKIATTTSFASEILHLDVPARPAINVGVPKPVTSSPVPVNILFSGETSGFASSDIIVGNGKVESVSGSYTASITPTTYGNVYISIRANAVNEGNFSSTSSFTYQLPSALESNKTSLLSVYPTFVKDIVNIQLPETTGVFEYKIFDCTGMLVSQGSLNDQANRIIVDGYNQGLYFIKIANKILNVNETFKFIKQ